MAITKPTTGATGWDDEVNAVIDRVNDTDTMCYYPLSGMGFHSASLAPEAANSQSTLIPWVVRVWVPSATAITKVGVAVHVVGAVGAGGLNGFAIYADDGSSKLGETASSTTPWTSVGLNSINLSSSISASSTGRFVRVVANLEGLTTNPTVAFLDGGGVEASGAPALNGNGTTQRRSAYKSAYSGSFPSTITPSTLGTPSDFLPLIFLG